LTTGRRSKRDDRDRTEFKSARIPLLFSVQRRRSKLDGTRWSVYPRLSAA